MYEIERQVGAGEVNSDGFLSLSAAADMMMDCSCFQLDSEAAFDEFCRREKISVFLAHRQIDILRRPEYGERLTIATLVYDCRSVFGLRNTVIRDASGELCFASCSAGAFVSIATGRPVKLPVPVQKQLIIDPPLDMEYLPRKVALPSVEPQAQRRLQVPRSFIDGNRHMNSNKYITVAEDLIEADFPYRRMRIEYKTPSVAGETLAMELYCVSGLRTVRLSHADGTPAAAVEFSF